MKPEKPRFPRIGILAALVTVAALALAPAAGAKTQTLTGETKVAKVTGKGQNLAIKVVVALKRGNRNVGGLNFPACGSGGLSEICGGTLNLKGLGTGLSVLFTWNCQVKQSGGTTCAKSVTSPISDAAGVNRGSITLKTGPPVGSGLQKGKTFKVKVSTA